MSTPMRRQYLQIKKQYPQAIVFFRLGDFYETFDADAELVADVCDIALTSRPVGKNQRVPLAGVPYHSADTYIARLIAAGHKVAIVEQVGGGVSSHLRSGMSRGGGNKAAEDGARGLVHREVVRVVTPGTVVEPTLLDDRLNNYLAALVIEGNRAGLAYADISTGEFAATQLDATGGWRVIAEELTRLQPAEVLVPDLQATQLSELAATLSGFRSPASDLQSLVSHYDAWHFDLETARQALLNHFDVATLDGFGLEGKPLAIRAAGAILQYLTQTHPHRGKPLEGERGALDHLSRIVTYSTDGFMNLDAATRRNLELTQTLRTGAVQGSLLGVLDLTVTPMGARRLRSWLLQPLLDLEALVQRFDAVEALVQNTSSRAELRADLKGVADLERLANRAAQGIIRPRELLALRESLEAIPPLREAMSAIVSEARDTTLLLHTIQSAMDSCPEVVELIAQAVADSPPAAPTSPGIIRAGFSAELDNILIAARDAKAWIANLERTERQRTGIKNLKVGFNKVFGYYLEVSKANLSAAPAEYIRKQTLVNAERFITPELKEYESLVLNAEERQLEVEMRIYREVCAQVAAAAHRLLATARALAQLDTCAALAEAAVRYNYVRPELTHDVCIEIAAGRHPVVEQMALRGTLELFVPNDAQLSGDELMLIITGPNMSGKSTYLRQVALIVLMAQIGSFVPADKARVGLVDRIFTRIGAEDIIHAGQSTFMVEMVETANILHHATRRSLLILDEIGRGTSTYDGLSIAWAVVEYIHNHPDLQARTLFATHYHELTELAGLLPHVRNYNVAVAEQGDGVVFLHKIIPGGADRSYGIHVAQLAGLPRSVINRAQEILSQLEREGARSPSPHVQASGRAEPAARQLALFGSEPHPVIKFLRQLDVNSLTPLEAISKLYEMQSQVRKEDDS
ncbi:MAG: DNA mismatch repair protein MutS [Anaerolineales bacterium]|nr:MAG: DNA mismatch repair protein MutS [Anaerolineales bacterium]